MARWRPLEKVVGETPDRGRVGCRCELLLAAAAAADAAAAPVTL